MTNSGKHYCFVGMRWSFECELGMFELHTFSHHWECVTRYTFYEFLRKSVLCRCFHDCKVNSFNSNSKVIRSMCAVITDRIFTMWNGRSTRAVFRKMHTTILQCRYAACVTAVHMCMSVHVLISVRMQLFVNTHIPLISYVMLQTFHWIIQLHLHVTVAWTKIWHPWYPMLCKTVFLTLMTFLQCGCNWCQNVNKSSVLLVLATATRHWFVHLAMSMLPMLAWVHRLESLQRASQLPGRFPVTRKLTNNSASSPQSRNDVLLGRNQVHCRLLRLRGICWTAGHMTTMSHR